MIEVLTPQEMREADAQAVAALGVDTLMRNAGTAVAAYVREHLPPGSRIVAFAGPGNNGGDARAACAQLSEYDCVVLGPDDMPRDDTAAREAIAGAALAIDALFGTGARLPLPASYAPAVRALDARERPVLAIDIPSGVDARTGAVPGDAVRATATLTLAAMKPGLLFDPARAYCGGALDRRHRHRRSDAASARAHVCGASRQRISANCCRVRRRATPTNAAPVRLRRSRLRRNLPARPSYAHVVPRVRAPAMPRLRRHRKRSTHYTRISSNKSWSSPAMTY